jgi:beta-lactamase class D
MVIVPESCNISVEWVRPNRMSLFKVWLSVIYFKVQLKKDNQTIQWPKDKDNQTIQWPKKKDNQTNNGRQIMKSYQLHKCIQLYFKVNNWKSNIYHLEMDT